MSDPDVKTKQAGRSAAWHTGARDFAMKFMPKSTPKYGVKRMLPYYCGVWIGSIEASGEHFIGTPLRVIKARSVTQHNQMGRDSRPKQSTRCKALRAHLTDEEDQGNDEEDRPEEIQMEIDTTNKAQVRQSKTLRRSRTSFSRHEIYVSMGRTLVAWGARKSRLSLATAKTARS